MWKQLKPKETQRKSQMKQCLLLPMANEHEGLVKRMGGDSEDMTSDKETLSLRDPLTRK